MSITEHADVFCAVKSEALNQRLRLYGGLGST